MTVNFNQTVANAIDRQRLALSEATVERQYEMWPQLAERYGEAGRAKCLQDAAYHLSYLSESLAAGVPSLFSNYVAWAKAMLAGRGIPAEDLALNLRCIQQALRQTLSQEESAAACRYLDAALEQLAQLPSEVPTFIDFQAPMAELANLYLAALLRGERHAASKLILEAVSSGASVKEIYLNVFQRTQYEIGRLWQLNKLSVAQEHYCTAATQLIMSQLYPYIFSGQKNGRRLVATCVGGELHEIGIRMISDFFEMEGWDTYYLGAGTPAQAVTQAVEQRGADVLAVSATITMHVRAVAEMVRAVRASSNHKAKVIVGGYPFNIAPDLWRQVGADAYASGAQEAIAVANQLVSQ